MLRACEEIRSPNTAKVRLNQAIGGQFEILEGPRAFLRSYCPPLPATMSTVTVPPVNASETKASLSRAIHTGADLFVALFEAEKAKIASASIKTLQDLEARFFEFQQTSQTTIADYARRLAESESAVRTAQAARAQAVTEGSLAQEQMSAVQRQLMQAKRELDHLHAFSKFARNNNPIKLALEQTSDGAPVTPKEMQDAGVQADDMNLLVSLRDLRKQLIATRQLLEEMERNCKAVEKERDDLRATMGTEVMMLKDRIFSLQSEAELTKGLRALSQERSRDSEMLVNIATPAAGDDTNGSPHTTTPRDGVQQREHVICVNHELTYAHL
jgi:hypothetical protein